MTGISIISEKLENIQRLRELQTSEKMDTENRENTEMTRNYLIGAGVRSDDMGTFNTLSTMYHAGLIDHIQVMLIPQEDKLFRKHLEVISSSGAYIIVHAPHHGQGVNPCAPTAFETRSPAEISAWIESAMSQTFEAADLLDTPSIVMHAGRYESGKKDAAISTLQEFLSIYRDPRIILENLPEVYAGFHLLGSTADELVQISDGLVNGYCLDFAHLYCTTNFLHLSYARELSKFGDLSDSHPVKLHHLSNSIKGSITDEHLELNHKNGGLDFDLVIGYIKKHPDIQTSLEYKQNNAEIYVEQLKVFDNLYHRH